MTGRTYNIHSFLHELTGGRFNSKFLCKKGIHNYRLHIVYETTPFVESVENPPIVITHHAKKWFLVRECKCCGKKTDLGEI